MKIEKCAKSKNRKCGKSSQLLSLLLPDIDYKKIPVEKKLKVNWMKYLDDVTKDVYFFSNEDISNPKKEHKCNFNHLILYAEYIKRVMNFTSEFEIKNFRVEQLNYCGMKMLKKWTDVFGKVRPNMTYTFSCLIRDDIYPEDFWKQMNENGYLIFLFYDGESLLKKSSIKPNYMLTSSPEKPYVEQFISKI